MAERRPTILQIIPELDTGGAELSTLEIAEAVHRAGGRAIVLSEGGRLVSPLEEAGGEFVPFPAATKNPVRMLWNAGRIARYALEQGVDLIHARSRAPAWSGLIAARRAGKPFVTTYHGAYKENGRFKSWYNSVMAAGDAVIANSGYTADLIRSRYDTPEAKITVIHRGVDGRVFDPSLVPAGRVAALRKAWAVGAGQPVVLQAARLTGWKGQAVVIEAARLLHEQSRLGDAVVILAGDAQGREAYAETLKAQIAAAGLDANVRLVGHVTDMPAAFAASRVAVVASTEPEAFGRTAAEAQAMGCPVIATAIGAPPETVLAAPASPAREITGWLVPPGDAGALAAVLREALSLGDEQRAAMAARARRHVLDDLSLDAMKRSTLGVYDRLLGTTMVKSWEKARPLPTA